MDGYAKYGDRSKKKEAKCMAKYSSVAVFTGMVG
jgi:hypothetical protein